MDAETIATLIGNVGFPIVCCCVMFVIYYKMSETLSELNSTIQELYTLLLKKVLEDEGD